MTEREQVKKIVNNNALLSKYEVGMHKATSGSQWFQSIWASQMLKQYDSYMGQPALQRWLASQDSQSLLPARISKCKNELRVTEKVIALRRDSFSKELSQLPVNACRDHSVVRDSSQWSSCCINSPAALTEPVLWRCPSWVSDILGI